RNSLLTESSWGSALKMRKTTIETRIIEDMDPVIECTLQEFGCAKKRMQYIEYLLVFLASRVRNYGCKEDKFSKGTIILHAIAYLAEAGCWEDSLQRVDRNILIMGSEAVYHKPYRKMK